MKKVIIIFLSIAILAGCEAKFKWERPLHSIERNAAIEGSFVLGCGSINQNEYFFAWVELSDGGLSLLRTRRAYTIIYEGYDTPRAEQWNDLNCRYYHYKLYVPAGTILREFKL